MPVQTKSLISSKPSEKKDTTKPVNETGSIGQSKTLTANALQARTLRTVAKRAPAIAHVAMKQKK
jgi:hypothetical protein